MSLRVIVTDGSHAADDDPIGVRPPDESRWRPARRAPGIIRHPEATFVAAR